MPITNHNCHNMNISRGDHTPLRFITTCDKVCYPILYAIDNLNIMKFVLHIYNHSECNFILVLIFFIFIFVAIVLVQFHIIIVSNGIFIRKNNHQNRLLV